MDERNYGHQGAAGILGGARAMQQGERQQAQHGTNLGVLGMAVPDFQWNRDGSRMFEDAALELLTKDKELAKAILPQARALQMQKQTLDRLMMIGQSAGEDVTALGPIQEYLEEQRQRMSRDILAKANLPSSASKPKFKVKAPRM